MTKAPTRGLRLFRTCWPRRVGASKLPDPRGPIAQRLEQGTHNPLVPGSNPGGPTIPRADVLLRTRDYPSGLAGRVDVHLSPHARVHAWCAISVGFARVFRVTQGLLRSDRSPSWLADHRCQPG